AVELAGQALLQVTQPSVDLGHGHAVGGVLEGNEEDPAHEDQADAAEAAGDHVGQLRRRAGRAAHPPPAGDHRDEARQDPHAPARLAPVERGQRREAPTAVRRREDGLDGFVAQQRVFHSNGLQVLHHSSPSGSCMGSNGHVVVRLLRARAWRAPQRRPKAITRRNGKAAIDSNTRKKPPRKALRTFFTGSADAGVMSPRFPSRLPALAANPARGVAVVLAAGVGAAGVTDGAASSGPAVDDRSNELPLDPVSVDPVDESVDAVDVLPVLDVSPPLVRSPESPVDASARAEVNPNRYTESVGVTDVPWWTTSTPALVAVTSPPTVFG